MKFRFKKDRAGFYRGVIFPKGEYVEVSDEMAERLKDHPSFEAPKRKVKKSEAENDDA